MKISNQLKSKILESITDNIDLYLNELDKLDRTNQISHEAWQLTHKPACSLVNSIYANVVDNIELYGKVKPRK